tara:strand:- start:364 stop:651 length:288 start_codon:yes stop_codon:yes gene_type:complete
MNNNYSQVEKISIIVDITKKLMNFPSSQGGNINLLNKNYLYVNRFKEITRKWINTEHSEFHGVIRFEEISKHFEYDFPCCKDKEPLFVLRHKQLI